MKTGHEEARTDTERGYVIVPKSVIRDDRISDGAKIILGEIMSLSEERGYCYAGNRYFAERHGITRESVSRLISRLEAAGYVKVEQVRGDGGREIVERRVWVNTDVPALRELMAWYRQKRQGGIDADGKAPTDENVKENNKYESDKYEKQVVPKGASGTVVLSEAEHRDLADRFGEARVDRAVVSYSSWKERKHARPKSDYDALVKWLTKGRGGRGPAVRECGADGGAAAGLTDIPF